MPSSVRNHSETILLYVHHTFENFWCPNAFLRKVMVLHRVLDILSKVVKRSMHPYVTMFSNFSSKTSHLVNWSVNNPIRHIVLYRIVRVHLPNFVLID